MAKILRYKLTSSHPSTGIKTPPGSTFISAGIMPSGPSVFALVPNPDLAPTEEHFFGCFQTGQDCPDWIADKHLLGTLIMHTMEKPLQPVTTHIFEITKNEAKSLSIIS